MTHFSRVDIGERTGHQRADKGTQFENGSEQTFDLSTFPVGVDTVGRVIANVLE